MVCHAARALPILVELGAHRLQNMLASVQFRLFLVFPNCISNFLAIYLQGCHELSHFVARDAIRLLGCWLVLELRLGNLRKQGDLIGAAGGKVAILKEPLVEPQGVNPQPCLLFQQFLLRL